MSDATRARLVNPKTKTIKNKPKQFSFCRFVCSTFDTSETRNGMRRKSETLSAPHLLGVLPGSFREDARHHLQGLGKLLDGVLVQSRLRSKKRTRPKGPNQPSTKRGRLEIDSGKDRVGVRRQRVCTATAVQPKLRPKKVSLRYPRRCGLSWHEEKQRAERTAAHS